MTTRGLICPAWEIQAFLRGSKTQIRRPVKPQPPDWAAVVQRMNP